MSNLSKLKARLLANPETRHDMRQQGRVTTWKDDRGFGFITPDSGGEQIFFHISSFSGRRRRPDVSDLVSYEISVEGQGRPQAKAVAFVDEKSARFVVQRRSVLPVLLAVFFLVFVVGANAVGRIPSAVPAIYIVASIVAFSAYVFDKSAARRNQWRVQESTLHLFAFLGGWPGALVAQRLLRHKTSKASFQIIFWSTVVLNCGALAWSLSDSGTSVLKSLLGAW